MDSDRRQLEINIQADDLVTEVIQAAILRLKNWESWTHQEPGNKYTKALKRIEIPSEKYKSEFHENTLEPENSCKKKSKKTVVNFRDPSIEVSDPEGFDDGESEQEVVWTDEDEVTRL